MEGRLVGLLYYLVSAAYLHVAFSADFQNCQKFKVIPTENYDTSSSSADDASKRPLGFVKSDVFYPGINSNVVKPCAFLTNLTSKYVQVLIQPDPGSKLCMKDDGVPPKKMCSAGGAISSCYAAHSDTVKFEFYCDTGEGCDSDAGFWYRLTPSEGDPDDWCREYQVQYPQNLLEAPPDAGKRRTTAKPDGGACTMGTSLMLVIAAVLLVSGL